MTLLGFGPDSGTKAMASIIVTWRATEPAWSAPPRTALSATGRGQLPPAGANIVDEAIRALPAVPLPRSRLVRLHLLRSRDSPHQGPAIQRVRMVAG